MTQVQFTKNVQKICDLLKDVLMDNKRTRPDESKPDPFKAKAKPSVGVRDYIDRILRYTKIEESTLIISLIYIDRLCEYYNYFITDRNIHRVILIAVVLAIKYNEDDLYSNNYFAKVGGVAVQELNYLEIQFLKMINYKLFIKEDTYVKYKAHLKRFNESTPRMA
jgi:hypothetical protein